MRPPTYALALALVLTVGLAGPPAGAAPRPAAPAAPATTTATAPARAPSPQSSPGQVAHTWSPMYMSDDHDYTRAQTLAMARRFDLIVSMPYGLKDHAAAMRRENPDLTLLAYSNATLGSPDQVRGLPEAAFAHTASGARIKATDFGTFLMESSHPTWRAASAQQCRERSALGGFDGCLVDMLTLGIFSRGYVSGLPVNPATGSTYTQGQYRDQMSALAADLRGRNPGLIQIGNMVENSYRYWEADVPSRPLVASGPSAQMEDFLRGARDGAGEWPSTAEWRRDVEVVTDMEATGKTGLFTTKLWSGASPSQVRQWHGYAMASFLMGADGGSYFAFTRSRDQAGAAQVNAPYAMPKRLGLPTGPMRAHDSGAFVRAFAGGYAVVNPTGRQVRVSLPGPLRNLAGRSGGTVVLAPHSGDVLVDAPAPAYRPTVRRSGDGVRRMVEDRWRPVLVRVGNTGAQAAPRGFVKADGPRLRTRGRPVPSLAPGETVRLRVMVRVVDYKRDGRKVVRLVYRAGTERDQVRFRIRDARR